MVVGLPRGIASFRLVIKERSGSRLIIFAVIYMFVPIDQLTYTLLRNAMSMIVARKARANIRSIINVYSLFLSD